MKAPRSGVFPVFGDRKRTIVDHRHVLREAPIRTESHGHFDHLSPAGDMLRRAGKTGPEALRILPGGTLPLEY